MYEEGLRRTKQFPDMDYHVAPWGDHPQEMKWRPSRRKLEDHEFNWRVGPATKHSGLLAHVEEPELLSKRPPFIDKSSTKALPNVYDAEVERCKQKAWQKQLMKRRQAAAAEDRWERTQVLELEAWERSHVRRPLASSASLPTLGGLSASQSTATRNPQRSTPESGLQFARQRL